MAKKALLDVLEQTIGKYVRNLDAESLNVAVWSGKIELNSLELDVVAVNGELDRQAAEAPNLAVPFRVVSGQFGNFTVDVPWSNLMSKSVVLRASSLTVVLEPYDRTASADFLTLIVESEAQRAKKVLQQRSQSITLADDFRKRKNAIQELAQKDLQQNPSDDSKTSESFGARLVRRIIENIQVEINGVHLTIRGDQCSAGVVLKSLQLVTTDKDGNQTFVDRTKTSVEPDDNAFLYKALAIRGLGIYLDDLNDNLNSTDSSFRLSSIKEDVNHSETPPEHDSGLDHSYILAPLSFQATLRQADSRVCVDFPKYLLRSELNALSILFSRKQFELANSIAQQIRPSRDVARPLFPEYRPLVRVSSATAIDWWKYATRCIGRLNGRRSWQEFFLAFQKRKRYIALYKRFAHSQNCPWMLPLDEDEMKEMEDIELDRSISVDGIMTWRNLADAQIRKELEKHNARQATKKASTSIFSSLFGTSTASKPVVDHDEPPITLTTEEMIEFEKLGEFTEPELSEESKLYDVNFILGALQIHLSSHGARQLAAFNMGTVSLGFCANKDGSFNFDFAMASLVLYDKVTINTFFPSILRSNSQGTVEDYEFVESTDNASNSQQALCLQMSKSKEGNQKLGIKLNTFEAVASSLFLKEMKRFLSPTQQVPTESNNALLTRSLSGSIDLFYDATDGTYPLRESRSSNVKTGLITSNDNGQHVTTDISQKLIEAWNLKTEIKSTWTIDLDLQAPIVFVPGSCTEAMASVLVFDLGHFRLNYGKHEGTGKVQKWFQDNPRVGVETADTQLDSGCIRISSLSFTIGKVASWRSLAQKRDNKVESNIEAVIEPVSLRLDIGVESGHQEIPRACVLGVLPSIALRLSYDQLAKIISVASTWKRYLNEIFPKEEADDTNLEIEEPDESLAVQSISSVGITNRLIERASIFAVNNASDPIPFPKMYVDLRLQRFSIAVQTKDGGALEANLVSVAASASVMSDASSTANISMGWFWIQDLLHYVDIPRVDRFVAHSKLPISQDYTISNQNNDVLKMLESMGVFEEDFEGSTDLADISYKQRPAQKSFGSLDPFSCANWEGNDYDVDAIIEAEFSSLYINWNPKVVKNIVAQMGEFFESISTKKDEPGTIIVTETPISQRTRLNSYTSSRADDSLFSVTKNSTLLCKMKMAGIYLALNSAIDDLPIFTLSMASSNVSVVLEGQERILSFILGELKIVSPEMGKTNSMYRTVLGLSSDRSDSLLSIQYCSGPKAIKAVTKDGNSAIGCDSFGIIDLSPMRMVYIQAQVLALVEYFTAGVLGAIATQAAASAAHAAAEIAKPTSSKSKFLVQASHLELWVPTAAYKTEFMAVIIKQIVVEYTATLETGGLANISLSDVTMRDSRNNFMLQIPVCIDLSVLLPPDDVGNKEDQALRVDMRISKAPFTLLSIQYVQLFAMLEENIGDIDLYLRNEAVAPLGLDDNKPVGEKTTESMTAGPEISHAGVEVVYNPRWIYLNIDMKSLSLELCGNDSDDPIVLITAVEASVEMIMQSNIGKKSIVVILKDLFCDDQREKAFARQHRSLIYQASRSGDKKSQEEAFVITYTTDLTKKVSTVDFRIGSPKFVLIPDAISDVLAFLGQSRSNVPTTSLPKQQHVEFKETVEVISADGESKIETSLVKTPDKQVSTFVLSLATSSCSVIFVDLGSALTTRNSGRDVSVRSLSETLVLGGVFNGRAKLATDDSDGTKIRVESEFHGEKIEVFSAVGHNQISAVQILEPTNCALYYDSKMTSEVTQDVRVQVAFLTPLDVTMSMRNIALINAISMSLNECFESDNKVDDPAETSNIGLSRFETERIIEIASVLERDDGDDSQQGIEVTQEVVERDIADISKPTILVTRQFYFKMTTADICCTVVNDLQGGDEALLRMSTRNFVANGEILEGSRIQPSLPPFTAFVLNVHTSVLSDYFDSISNSWNKFLRKPWELALNCRRGTNQLLRSNRPSTTIEVESWPCYISFSEQFLMSLASANRMWAVFSAASASAIESVNDSSALSNQMRRSMAASAARSFVASLPYAIDNRSGIDLDILISGNEEIKRCSHGTVEFFRFEPPKGQGTGGVRRYGQDVKFEKSIVVLIGDSSLKVDNVDSLLGRQKKSHKLDDGVVVMTHVSKEGKAITLHISTGFEFRNITCIPFRLSVLENDEAASFGECEATSFRHRNRDKYSVSKPSLMINDEAVSKSSRRLAIPTQLMKKFMIEWCESGDAKLQLLFNPEVNTKYEAWELRGATKLTINKRYFTGQTSERICNRFDVVCYPVARNGLQTTDPPRDLNLFVFQLSIYMELVDGLYPTINVHIEPRASLTNKLPIGIQIKSPMPYIFGSHEENETNQMDGTIYPIEPDSHLEIFTSGPSLAVMVKCSDLLVGGTPTEWIERGWVDLSLASEFKMQEPMHCLFPFVRKFNDPLSLSGASGSEFLIVDGSKGMKKLTHLGDAAHHNAPAESTTAPTSGQSDVVDDDWRSFFVTVRNYAVDHTGSVLFEQVESNAKASMRRNVSFVESRRASLNYQVSPAFAAYTLPGSNSRFSLLPGSSVPIRLLHLSMQGEDGLQRTLPFHIDDISICEGGVDATPLCWENGTSSGFYAYRRLVNSYQSEIHIVPEYIVYNGSESHQVRVWHKNEEIMVQPGKFAPLRIFDTNAAAITIEYTDLGGRTPLVRIDTLGLRVAIVTLEDGTPVARVAIQTVVGTRDSRLVVKLGDIQKGALISQHVATNDDFRDLQNDFFRFRIKWSELQLTLNEARPTAGTGSAYMEAALDEVQKIVSPQPSRIGSTGAPKETWVQGRQRAKGEASVSANRPLCTIRFHRFTIDWQRIFKDDQARNGQSPERSQLSIEIHQVQIKDETPGSQYPIVFDSTSGLSFFDLCIRIRGSATSDLVQVDLVDLNIAHRDGVSEKIFMSTCEEFVWKLLDVANRIVEAAAEFAGVRITLSWDDEQECYTVAVYEQNSATSEMQTKYTPPRSDKLYSIRKTRVSPFTVVLSFRRNPQASRYKIFTDVRGAPILNYFTRQLKFKIDKAELKFARYEANNVKGPSDRIIELLSTVYLSRIQTKFVTIMTAASFQDWKYLASRDEGDDAFMDGDILRVTGNLAGRSAGYVFRQAGQGLGGGVSSAANAVGQGIENASAALGARVIGAGVNSVVTGVGEGLGDAVSGVGTGAGHLLQGAGQGVGHVFGGLTGGALIMTKGIGRGIVSGNARAATSGIVQGVNTMGTGVGQGVESVVSGTAEGVISVGQGLFSGVKNVGKGIGGALLGICSCSSCCGGEERGHDNALLDPLLSDD